MLNKFHFNLQLFAEGASSAGGEGSGVSSAAAGQNSSPAGENGANTALTEQSGKPSFEDKLRSLGVPEAKIKRHAGYKSKNMSPAAEGDTGVIPETNAGEAEKPAKPNEEARRLTFDEILADPEYNKSVQDIVKSRLREEKAKSDRERSLGREAGESLKALDPALRLIAKSYGLDSEKLDYTRLAHEIEGDSRYISDTAVEMGLDNEAARRFSQLERENDRLRRSETERQARESQRLIMEQNETHIRGLEAQGERLREVFPNFDLRAELKNPAFARMTSPSGGISVEDAYYAIHRKEIQEASMKAAAKKTAEKLTNSIISGQSRPSEAGTSSQATSVTGFDFRNSSAAERNAIKEKMKQAAAQGKKLYPGGIIK